MTIQTFLCIKCILLW